MLCTVSNDRDVYAKEDEDGEGRVVRGSLQALLAFDYLSGW